MSNGGRRALHRAANASAMMAFLAGCGFGASDFGNVVTPYCDEGERVVSGQCEPCPEGLTSPAGALQSGPDTLCQCPPGLEPIPTSSTSTTTSDLECRPTLCEENQRVEDNTCVACEPGLGRPAGDPSDGPDTECSPLACPVDTRVQDNQCVACPELSTNEAGDLASGPDTACDCLPGSQTATMALQTVGEACIATVCEMDQGVANNECQACEPGTIYPPHRAAPAPPPLDTTAEDTPCVEDACFGGLSVLCRDFEEAVVEGSEVAAVDNFGFAIALDGDVLAVGAPTEVDETGRPNGVAYVYRRSGTTWTLEDLVTAPVADTDLPLSFGAAVSVRDGVLLVGAPDADDGRGAAYVFVRDPNANEDAWGTPVDRLVPADDLGRFDRFGEAVAIDDDRTILVGAPGQATGAAFVFEPREVPDKWGEPQILAPSGSAAFGASVAIKDDRLVVGAPFENDRGIVYIYVDDGAGFAFEREFRSPRAERGTEFGRSVAFDGTTIVVGAPRESASLPGMGISSNVGAVYIHDSSGDLLDDARASNQGRDQFGARVAVDGDLLVIGAPFEDGAFGEFEDPDGDNAVPDAGAVYIFRGPTTWTQVAYVKAPSPREGENVGRGVAIDEGRTAIGAVGRQTGGVVYVRRVRADE